jgi:hypothetical protein
MKKSIFIISILVSLFLVTGCVRNADEVNLTEEALTDNTLTNINTEMINENPQPNKTIVMKTNKGDITIELFNETMPITANNFLRLAQEDFYDGVIFHRVIQVLTNLLRTIKTTKELYRWQILVLIQVEVSSLLIL